LQLGGTVRSLVWARLLQADEPPVVGCAVMVKVTHSPLSRRPPLSSASTTTVFPTLAESQSSLWFEVGFPSEMFVKLAGRSTSRQPSRVELPLVLLVNVREKIVD
jgi:hypothetical protein